MVIPKAVLSATAIEEDFDDQSFSSPLTYYGPDGYDSGWVYDSNNAHGGSGYCLRRNDSEDASPAGFGGALIDSSLSSHISNGVYIKYWIKYASNYDATGSFDNIKLFKAAGTVADIEFIWKTPPFGAIQLFGKDTSGDLSFNATPSVSGFSRGTWHKIEMYIYIPSSGTPTVKLQINDTTIYTTNNADIHRGPYSSTMQINSVRAGNMGAATAGEGYVYYDDILVVYGEGDLTEGGESPNPQIAGQCGAGTDIVWQ
jgi:hypothetical protein